MKNVALIVAVGTLLGCSKEKNMSNGELIFRTGKNKGGEVVSYNGTTKLASGCEGCHGRWGGNFINKKESIRYKDLVNPDYRDIPYNDSLVIRFLDEKKKSDGTSACTPIVSVMSSTDKLDLLNFLKSL